uniref:Major facilitator superfamily (MFS) profile domain-containing protein n=1 Tax=Chaetoceros debilis TaxID=122233 RepID=A0A7S3PUF4_9STRA
MSTEEGDSEPQMQAQTFPPVNEEDITPHSFDFSEQEELNSDSHSHPSHHDHDDHEGDGVSDISNDSGSEEDDDVETDSPLEISVANHNNGMSGADIIRGRATSSNSRQLSTAENSRSNSSSGPGSLRQLVGNVGVGGASTHTYRMVQSEMSRTSARRRDSGNMNSRVHGSFGQLSNITTPHSVEGGSPEGQVRHSISSQPVTSQYTGFSGHHHTRPPMLERGFRSMYQEEVSRRIGANSNRSGARHYSYRSANNYHNQNHERSHSSRNSLSHGSSYSHSHHSMPSEDTSNMSPYYEPTGSWLRLRPQNSANFPYRSRFMGQRQSSAPGQSESVSNNSTFAPRNPWPPHHHYNYPPSGGAGPIHEDEECLPSASEPSTEGRFVAATAIPLHSHELIGSHPSHSNNDLVTHETTHITEPTCVTADVPRSFHQEDLENCNEPFSSTHAIAEVQKVLTEYVENVPNEKPTTRDDLPEGDEASTPLPPIENVHIHSSEKKQKQWDQSADVSHHTGIGDHDNKEDMSHISDNGNGPSLQPAVDIQWASPDSKYERYACRVDREQGDKAVEIPLFLFQRPHMRGFHFAWMSFFVAFFTWFSLAPLLGEIKLSLHLNHEQIFMSNVFSSAGTVICRLIAGPLCDRFGARIIMSATLVVGAIPVMATGLVNTAAELYILRLITGVAGASFVVTQYWTSCMFTREIAGTANSLVAGWGNLGGGLTQIVMGSALFPLFKVIYSYSSSDEREVADRAWRIVFIVPAILSLAMAVLVMKFSDDSPKGNYRKLKRLGLMPRVQAMKAVKDAATDMNTWLLFVQYACCFGVEVTMTAGLALYFIDEFKQSTESAAALASIFGWMNLFARGLGGFISDIMNVRMGMKGRLIWQFVSMLAEGAMLIAFAYVKTLGGAIGTMVLFSLFVQSTEGSTFSIIPYVCPTATGSVAGIVGAGGNVGGVVFLLMIQQWSYRQGFRVMAFSVLCCSVFSFFIVIRGHAGFFCGRDSNEVSERINGDKRSKLRGAEEAYEHSARTTSETQVPSEPIARTSAGVNVYNHPKEAYEHGACTNSETPISSEPITKTSMEVNA